MKLVEDKLFLTEDELKCVKNANVMASPSMAGIMLQNSFRSKQLVESVEQDNLDFYTKAILAYRKKNFEVI